MWQVWGHTCVRGARGAQKRSGVGDPEPQGHPGATGALAWLRGAGRSLAQSPPTPALCSRIYSFIRLI